MNFFNLLKYSALTVLSILVASNFSVYSQTDSGTLNGLGSEITHSVEQAMDSLFYVPGVQVAVVNEGSFIYSKGFGIADADTNTAVSNETGFYIASTTKSFVGMLGALLSEMDSLDLDAPISAYFHDLQFDSTGLDANRISLRDHLTHRHGYESDELAFYPPFIGSLTIDRMVHLVGRYAKPHSITFDYSNESYIMAAAAMERNTGVSWKDLLIQNIFQPIGMEHTTPYMSEARQGDFAYPHDFINNKFLRKSPKTDTNMHAAGGVVSTAEDLGRWLQVIMNGGSLNGRKVLPERAVREAIAPQVSLDNEFYGGIRRYAYGFGWYHAMLDGKILMHHFGGFTGFHCHMSYMPEYKIGVIVLANTGTIAPQDLAIRIYNLILDKENDDKYTSRLHMLAGDKREELLESRNEWLKERRLKKSARPLARYIGSFESPRLGTIHIRKEGNGLIAELGPKKSELIPFQNDVFLVNWYNQRTPINVELEKPDKLFFVNNYDHEIKALRWENPWFGELAVFEKK